MNIVYRILAKFLPTKDVVALVSFLTTFADKLAEAEARQSAIAQEYEKQIDELEGRRTDALKLANKASRMSRKLNGIIA